MSNKVVPALKIATKDLVYSSESDEPFEVFEWKDDEGPLTRERLLRFGGHAPNTPVEKVSLAKFFASLTMEEHWHGDKEKATVKRYQSLLAVINEHLIEPQVFRVGEIEIAVYVVGKAEEGAWVGVKTMAVET